MSDPVLFIPGLACTGELFADQIAAVSRERTVVLANHRRHDVLSDMAAAILAEAPARFVAVGLSMGGYVAFELLRQAPSRISGLVLADTTARPDTDEARERRYRMIEIVEAGRFRDLLPLMLPMLVAPERVDEAEIAAVVRRMLDDTGPEAYVRQQRVILSRPDSRPLLPAIACPTLVLVGDRDAITPPELAEEIAAAIEGAAFAAMPLCGHLSAIERPQAVTHALSAFLSGLDREPINPT